MIISFFFSIREVKYIDSFLFYVRPILPFWNKLHLARAFLSFYLSLLCLGSFSLCLWSVAFVDSSTHQVGI